MDKMNLKDIKRVKIKKFLKDVDNFIANYNYYGMITF